MAASNGFGCTRDIRLWEKPGEKESVFTMPYDTPPVKAEDGRVAVPTPFTCGKDPDQAE